MEIAVERIHDVDDTDYCAAYTVYVGDRRVLAISTYMTTTASKWIKDVVKSNRTKPGTIVIGVSVDRECPPSEKGGFHNSRYDLLQICVSGSHCLLFHLPEPYEIHSCVKFLDDLLNDPRVVSVGVDMVSVAKNLEKHHGISVKNPVNLPSLAAEKLKRDDLDLVRYDLDRLAPLVLGKHMYVVRPRKKVEWFGRRGYPYIWYERNLSCNKAKYATVDAYLCFLIGTKLLFDLVEDGGGDGTSSGKKKKKKMNKLNKK